MSFEVRRCESLDAWDAFVRASPDGSVFNRSPYLAQFDDVCFEPWIVRAGRRELLGVTILRHADGRLRERGFPWARAELLRGAAAFEGPAHSRIKENLEAFEALLAALKEHCARIAVRTPPGHEDLRALLWFNHQAPAEGAFRLTLRYTGLIDLGTAATFDDYLARIRPARRRQCRLAARQGVTVAPSGDLDILEYLHRLTFERQQLERDAVEVAMLRRIAAAALEHRFGELLVASLPSGEPASATLFLHDEKRGHYLAGANHPAHRGSYSGTLCFTESLRACFDRGLQAVDVCGINSPQRGDFKVSFDARPVPYFDAVWQKPQPA